MKPVQTIRDTGIFKDFTGYIIPTFLSSLGTVHVVMDLKK